MYKQLIFEYFISYDEMNNIIFSNIITGSNLRLRFLRSRYSQTGIGWNGHVLNRYRTIQIWITAVILSSWPRFLTSIGHIRDGIQIKHAFVNLIACKFSLFRWRLRVIHGKGHLIRPRRELNTRIQRLTI